MAFERRADQRCGGESTLQYVKGLLGLVIPYEGYVRM